MNNPQNSYQTIDTSTMYKYDNHLNIPWNLVEYKTPRHEMNVEEELRKRKWQSQKKGEKDKKYVTKRGFYMDYDLKVAKGIPSTHDHGTQKEWDFEKLKKQHQRLSVVDPKLSKYTFLDRIQMQQKSHKSPGIGTYSIQKSLKDKEAQKEQLKKKKLSQGQKMFFYQDIQHLSNLIPGAGNYSPHDVSPKARIDKTDYKFWTDKHKKETETFLKRENVKPASGTYSPMNVTISTFDRLANEFQKPNKKHLFGNDARFEYTRENKKKIVQKRPAPSSYRTTIDWKGKLDSPKKQIWTELVWKGHSQSLYH